MRHFSTRFLIVFIFLFVVPGYAELVPVPFRVESFRGQKLEEDYLFPNEWFDGLYEPHVKKMVGAAVTTGTFRAFQKILYGNFSWMFVVDIDPKVIEFNRLNYEAIVHAKSRREYLENFPTFYHQEFGSYPPGYDPKEDAFKDGAKRPLFDFLNGEAALISPDDVPESKGLINKFYFNSDRLFLKMKRKLTKINLVLIHQSVTSPELASRLAVFLKSIGIEISLLDLSNIMDYLLVTGGEVRSGNKKAAARLADFIRNLPLSNKAKVLFTVSLENAVYERLIGPDNNDTEDSFRYFIASPGNVLEMLQYKKSFSGRPPVALTRSGRCAQYLE